MSFFSKISDRNTLKCSICGRAINPGEFVCIIGKSPEKSYGGMTVPIINQWVKSSSGEIFCQPCFNKNCNG